MNKKIIAFVLAGIFAISMVAPAADAATLEEQIAELLAKIVSLEAQIAGQTIPAATAVCFDADLQQGMTSDSVKDLQIKLGVTPTSGYFGPITLAAVKTFQTSNGIINTGYVGPLTRGALNALYCTAVVPSTTYPAGCTSAVGFSPTTGLPCSEVTTLPEGCTSTAGFSPTTGLSCAGTTTTTVAAPSYGSLSVVSYPVSNPQTTLYGANTYETVAGQYKATGSDIAVKKVGVKISSSAATAFPWQAFSTVSVWDGATMLAELPVTSANAIENTFAQIYTFNLSGFNWVIPNGTQKVLTVKVTTVPSAVSAATGVTWTVSLLADVVSTDTAGVTYSTVSGSAITTGALTLSAAQSSSVTVTASTDNPLAGNVIASTSATSKVDVLKFNVKVENVNATFNSGTIKVATDGIKVANSYVTSLELWDGSTLVAAAAPSGWAGNIGTSTWSNFALPISAGTTKTLTVKAVLAQLPSTYTNDGTGLLNINTGPSLSGIDTNSNVVTAAGTGVTGASQYPFLSAPVFTYASSSVLVKNSSDTKINDIGDTAITFTVTANGVDNIYIPQSSNTSVTFGMNDTLTGPASHVASTSTTWTCNSPAVSDTSQEANKYLWEISSGSSANCTFSTYVNNSIASSTSGYFAVALGQAKWVTVSTSTTGSFITQTWGLTNVKTADFHLTATNP